MQKKFIMVRTGVLLRRFCMFMSLLTFGIYCVNFAALREATRSDFIREQLKNLAQSRLNNNSLSIVICPGDALYLFAQLVGTELASLMNKVPKFLEYESGSNMTLLSSDGPADIYFCEKGSTHIVALKQFYYKSELERHDVALLKSYLDADTMASLILPSHGILHYFDPSFKPIILRYHREPGRATAAQGVDLALDTKATLQTGYCPILHVPYLYPSFVLVGNVDPIVLTMSLPRSKWHKHFIGFLASYCSARVRSSSFRTYFFNHAFESFQDKSVLPIGNCIPRAYREKFGSEFLGIPERQKVTNKLVSAQMVQAAVKVLSKFKFVIAFENAQAPGYITEKIVNAKLSGGIPVYWGAPDVDMYLNTKSFIWCNVSTSQISWDTLFKEAEVLHSQAKEIDIVENKVFQLLGIEVFNPCLEQIRYLEENDDLYEQMIMEPLISKFEGSIVDPMRYAKAIKNLIDAKESLNSASQMD